MSDPRHLVIYNPSIHEITLQGFSSLFLYCSVSVLWSLEWTVVLVSVSECRRAVGTIPCTTRAMKCRRWSCSPGGVLDRHGPQSRSDRTRGGRGRVGVNFANRQEESNVRWQKHKRQETITLFSAMCSTTVGGRVEVRWGSTSIPSGVEEQAETSQSYVRHDSSLWFPVWRWFMSKRKNAHLDTHQTFAHTRTTLWFSPQKERERERER